MLINIGCKSFDFRGAELYVHKEDNTKVCRMVKMLTDFYLDCGQQRINGRESDYAVVDIITQKKDILAADVVEREYKKVVIGTPLMDFLGKYEMDSIYGNSELERLLAKTIVDEVYAECDVFAQVGREDLRTLIFTGLLSTLLGYLHASQTQDALLVFLAQILNSPLQNLAALFTQLSKLTHNLPNKNDDPFLGGNNGFGSLN
jgi:hypothetical protein